MILAALALLAAGQLQKAGPPPASTFTQLPARARWAGKDVDLSGYAARRAVPGHPGWEMWVSPQHGGVLVIGWAFATKVRHVQLLNRAKVDVPVDLGGPKKLLLPALSGWSFSFGLPPAGGPGTPAPIARLEQAALGEPEPRKTTDTGDLVTRLHEPMLAFLERWPDHGDGVRRYADALVRWNTQRPITGLCHPDGTPYGIRPADATSGAIEARWMGQHGTNAYGLNPGDVQHFHWTRTVDAYVVLDRDPWALWHAVSAFFVFERFEADPYEPLSRGVGNYSGSIRAPGRWALFCARLLDVLCDLGPEYGPLRTAVAESLSYHVARSWALCLASPIGVLASPWYYGSGLPGWVQAGEEDYQFSPQVAIWTLGMQRARDALLRFGDAAGADVAAEAYQAGLSYLSVDIVRDDALVYVQGVEGSWSPWDGHGTWMAYCLAPGPVGPTRARLLAFLRARGDDLPSDPNHEFAVSVAGPLLGH